MKNHSLALSVFLCLLSLPACQGQKEESRWTRQGNRSDAPLYAVWGSDANNVWAVGHAGTIVKWNGAVWTPQPSGTTGGIYDVWGSDANNVWAVGFGPKILK